MPMRRNSPPNLNTWRAFTQLRLSLKIQVSPVYSPFEL